MENSEKLNITRHSGENISINVQFKIQRQTSLSGLLDKLLCTAKSYAEYPSASVELWFCSVVKCACVKDSFYFPFIQKIKEVGQWEDFNDVWVCLVIRIDVSIIPEL